MVATGNARCPRPQSRHPSPGSENKPAGIGLGPDGLEPMDTATNPAGSQGPSLPGSPWIFFTAAQGEYVWRQHNYGPARGRRWQSWLTGAERAGWMDGRSRARRSAASQRARHDDWCGAVRTGRATGAVVRRRYVAVRRLLAPRVLLQARASSSWIIIISRELKAGGLVSVSGSRQLRCGRLRSNSSHYGAALIAAVMYYASRWCASWWCTAIVFCFFSSTVWSRAGRMEKRRRQLRFGLVMVLYGELFAFFGSTVWSHAVRWRRGGNKGIEDCANWQWKENSWTLLKGGIL